MTIQLRSKGGGIKSIQRGNITLSTGADANVTMSSVDTSKSFLNISNASGYTEGASSGSGSAIIGGGNITTSTNIFIQNGYSGSSGGNTIIYWEVIEYV